MHTVAIFRNQVVSKLPARREFMRSQRSSASVASRARRFHVPHSCLWVALGVIGLLAPLLTFAKDKVDLVVTNGTVITMDAQRRVIENGAVAVRGESIVAVGPGA